MTTRIHMTSRQKLMLVLLLGAQFMLAVDFSILTVALPDVGKGLNIALNNLQWVVTAFSLTAAGLTLFFGRIADIFGRRKLFLTGIVLLGLGSLLGGLASSAEILFLARVLQGIATAIVTPAALGLLTTSFAEGTLRDKALSLNGALLSAGFTTGSILGGVLTSWLNWRWAFFINVPVSIFIGVLTPFFIKDSKSQDVTRLDAAGALTVTGGLLTLVYGISEFGTSGLDHITTVLSLAVSIVLLASFLVIETKSKHPLISLKILRKPTVKWGNFGGFIVFTMESSMVFLTTVYLQKVLGLSPASTGLTFGLLGLSASLMGAFGGRLIERIGIKRSFVIGLTGQGITTLALWFAGPQKSWLPFVLVITAVNGALHVTGIISFMIMSTSGLANREEGAASSLTSMTQLTSISLGIPIISAIATAHINSLHTLPSKLAILGGYHYAILIDGTIAIAAALLVANRLKNQA